MSTQSFRFLCAGGLHLHAVLQGVEHLPEHLLELFVNAPYRAAEQVFQAAVREEVDFVVLTGDLLDAASGGPRAVAFLMQQLSLLQDHGIPVFWSASKLDLASDWLEHIELPSNVHIFSDDLVETKPVFVSERPAAVLHGRSWNAQRPLRPAEFAASDHEGVHVAVLYGACDLDNLPSRISFWAVGGAHTPSTTAQGRQVVHAPGSAQGFSPHQTGPHGCTLVHIDQAGDVRTRRLETDLVRWCEERVSVPDGVSLGDLKNALRMRIQKIMAEAGRAAAIHWNLVGDGWFDSPLVHHQRREEVLSWLQEEFGKGAQPAWSLSLEIEPPERVRDEWTDEDSILGDYLRIAREYLEDPSNPLTLDVPAAGKQLPAELQNALPITGAAARTNILRQAALLGVGLLRGDERANEVLALSGREE